MDTFPIFVLHKIMMKASFKIIYSDEAKKFLNSLDSNTYKKIIYNIDKAAFIRDPELFKKLDDEIWEFRTKFNRKQYRLLAFWDKRKNSETLVIATNGFIKKTKKTPKDEIVKAKQIMRFYFKNT